MTGPSGCGKSSPVRAGLLSTMAEDSDWLTLPPIVPGADPVTVLTRELAARAQRLVVVDQFEELLAQTPPMQ